MDTNQHPGRLCERCADHPEGVEGHELLTHAEDRDGVLARGLVGFRCSLCQTPWARAYAGGGQFNWLRASPLVDRTP